MKILDKKINKLIIHHTGGKFSNGLLGLLDSPSLIKFRHKYRRGFDDIGYHFIIGKTGLFIADGKLYEGRFETYQGAHARGHNSDSLGICLMGNYDIQSPSDKQLETLYNLLINKSRQYNISPQKILGHRELTGALTFCPGKNINLNKIRDIVASKI